MAQFEAQADKAAASSKAAKDAKSKETKEEREKREKYEKLMKKAEELTAARNHREVVSVLTQAKAHANAAQLKEIEEKIKAATAEMNKGSLFDLMEQEAQPEQTAYAQTPQTSATDCTATACIYTVFAASYAGTGTDSGAKTAAACTAATGIHTATDAGTGTARTAETATGIHAASAATGNMAAATTAATAAGKTADTAARAIRAADRRINTRRSLKCRTGRKRGSCRRTNSSNRTSPTRSTPHTVRRTMRNTLISHSPCWNPSIHLIRQFKPWHSKLKE